MPRVYLGYARRASRRLRRSPPSDSRRRPVAGESSVANAIVHAIAMLALGIDALNRGANECELVVGARAVASGRGPCPAATGNTPVNHLPQPAYATPNPWRADGDTAMHRARRPGAVACPQGGEVE